MGDKGKPSSNIGRDITQKKSLTSLCVGSAGADKCTQGEAVGKEESPVRRQRELFLFLPPGDRVLNSAAVFPACFGQTWLS